MTRIPWTDRENELIVRDYFAMLGEELAGRPYNKAEHNRRLRESIHRTRGAVEFKHENISAVLQALGEPWIEGYKPASNIQESLQTAVLQWLDGRPDAISDRASEAPGRDKDVILELGPPPTLRNEPPPKHLERIMDRSFRLDAAGRAERNRALGEAGEKRVLAHERAMLHHHGRPDLAARVRWVSKLDGDGAGFDIESWSLEETRRLLEVKTTGGWDRAPFYITDHELKVARRNPLEWRLFRVWDFWRRPRAFELQLPLEQHVTLTATNFHARFR